MSSFDQLLNIHLDIGTLPRECFSLPFETNNDSSQFDLIIFNNLLGNNRTVNEK